MEIVYGLLGFICGSWPSARKVDSISVEMRLTGMCKIHVLSNLIGKLSIRNLRRKNGMNIFTERPKNSLMDSCVN